MDSEQKQVCESCGALIPEGIKRCQKCGARISDKIKYIAKPTIVHTSFLAEQIWDRINAPKYLVYYFSTNEFQTLNEIDLGKRDHDRKIVYVPVNNDQIKKGVVIVPREAKETNWEEVLEEADNFVSFCYDPCGKEAMVKLLTRVVCGSWFLDRFIGDPLLEIAGAGKFAPIIPIRGPSQSGKNRLAFCFRMLSYRPYFEMSTYRIPSLYRPLDLWQGTLVLDEADMANTTERSEYIHFLNCRATGTPISRQDPLNPKRTYTFYNFGITILTQRKQFDDNATESRSLPFYSEVTDKQLPTVETDEMLKMGLELQDKLLFLRMKFYKRVIIDKSTWFNGVSDPRLNASLLPLIALSKHEKNISEVITQTVKEVEKLKIEEKSMSEDGLVVNYLWEKIQEGLFERWNYLFFVLQEKNIVKEGGNEREIKIPLTTTRLAEHFKWSAKITRKVIHGLSLCPENLPNVVKVDGRTYRVILFDPRKLEKRLREFVVGYQPDSLLKVTHVTEVTDLLYGGVEKGKESNNIEENLREGWKNEPYKESVTSVTCVTSGVSKKEVKESLGICELCGKTENVKEVFFKKLNKKIMVCNICLKEITKDRYETLNNDQGDIPKFLEEVLKELQPKSDFKFSFEEKQKTEEVKKEEDKETEYSLVFENKIGIENIGNIKMYVCKQIISYKNIKKDNEIKKELKYCNFKTLTFDDMKDHIKTHKMKF